MSAAAPCVGFSPFHVATMLSICESCPAEVKAACLQSAADAPFPFLEPQVWGGVVLPRDRDLLPASAVRVAARPDPRRVGRPSAFEVSGVDPDSCTSGSHTAVMSAGA